MIIKGLDSLPNHYFLVTMITKETVSFPTSIEEFEKDAEFLSTFPDESMDLPEDSYDSGYGCIMVERNPNGKKIEYPIREELGGDWYSDSKRIVEYKGKYYGVTTFSNQCGVDFHYTGEFFQGELPVETFLSFIKEWDCTVEEDWLFTQLFPSCSDFENDEYDEYSKFDSRYDYIKQEISEYRYIKTVTVGFKGIVEYNFDNPDQNNTTINSNDFTKDELCELISDMYGLPLSLLSKIEWDEDSLQRHLDKDMRCDWVESIQMNIGTIPSGPRAGERLPVNRRTIGDAIIKDLQQESGRDRVPYMFIWSQRLKIFINRIMVSMRLRNSLHRK